MTERSDSLARSAEEEKISKAISYGLPTLTIAAAAVVGVVIGPATSILVVSAGLILGVISLLWGSLRILTGDAALSPELEALDMQTQGTDALASRKKMLVRALKDLENEKGFGKIEEDDYEPIAQTYREELKVVLKRMDETLAPHRAKAEEAARTHLAKAGVGAPLDKPGKAQTSDAAETTPSPSEEKHDDDAARLTCPKCKASNEIDAKFCKECATSLSPSKKPTAASAAQEGDDENDDDENDEDDDE